MMTAKANIVNGKWSIVQALALPIFYSLFTLFAVPVHAAFEDKGTGARGTALGDTYVVMGDDVLSLAYNPAALARVRQKEVTSEYAKLFAGLSDGSNLSQTYLAYGQPVSWGGTLAVSWKQFGLDDLYKERTLSLGYGEWLTSKIAIGGALKQLYHSFGVPQIIVDNNGNVQSGTPDFFTQNGHSNTAYSADLGALYRWTDKTTLALSLQDINEPNIALSSADHEIVPRTTRLAISYARNRYLSFAGALQRRQTLSNQSDTIATGAAERKWSLIGGDRVAVRGSLAAGSRQYRQLALGGGYEMGALGFDYTFVFNLGGITLGDTSGTHRFSMSYRFGVPEAPAQPILKARQKETKKEEPKKEESVVLGELLVAKKATPKSVTQKPRKTPSSAYAQELNEMEQLIQGQPQRGSSGAKAAAPQSVSDVSKLIAQAQKSAQPGSAVIVIIPPSAGAGTPSEEQVTAEMMLGHLAKEAPKIEPPSDKAMKGIMEDPTTTTPTVTLEDLQVPLTAARPLGVSPVPQVKNIEELLVRVSSLLMAPSAHRVGAFEAQFDLWKSYFESSQKELTEFMDLEDELQNTKNYYAHLRSRQASEPERVNYLMRTLEKYLENILVNRPWNLQDARDLRYMAWLHLAWNYQRSLPAQGMSMNDGIASLQRIVNKAIRYEHEPPEPIRTAGPAKAAPAPKPVVTVPEVAPKPPTAQKAQEMRSESQIRYEKALLQYSRKVAAGATIAERIKLLKKILASCQQANLDCRLAYQEFEATFDEELQSAN